MLFICCSIILVCYATVTKTNNDKQTVEIMPLSYNYHIYSIVSNGLQYKVFFNHLVWFVIKGIHFFLLPFRRVQMTLSFLGYILSAKFSFSILLASRAHSVAQGVMMSRRQL